MESYQAIFKGFESGWNRVLSHFKEKAPNLVGGLGEELKP